MGKKTVLADTSILLDVFRKSIDIKRLLGELLGSYEIMIAESVQRELERLEKSSPHARMAQKFIEGMPVVATDEEGDDSLLELSASLNAVLLTSDRELIRRARMRKLHTISPRGDGRLMVMPSYADL